MKNQWENGNVYGGQFFRNVEEDDKDKHSDDDKNTPGMVGSEKQIDQIIETGSIITTKGNYTIHCLTIIGQVEGHFILPPQTKTTKYEHVIPQLVAIEEAANIDGLLILLNTVGGDVEAGLAIAELVAGMKKPTVSMVLGGGHSIGVPLAVAAKKSFIARSASMTVHPVRMNGLMLGVPQTFEYFQRMQERITRFVSENSNITPERFIELAMNTRELVMDVGTVLDGKDAVQEGLIDYLGNLSDALDCLYRMIDEDRQNEKSADEKKDSKGDLKDAKNLKKPKSPKNPKNDKSIKKKS